MKAEIVKSCRDSETSKQYTRTLSRRLRAEISKRGWTYRDCARALGIHENTTYRWLETKNPTAPSLFMLAKLCRLLNIDANKLLGISR